MLLIAQIKHIKNYITIKWKLSFRKAVIKMEETYHDLIKTVYDYIEPLKSVHAVKMYL
jgi:hypothetical protein